MQTCRMSSGTVPEVRPMHQVQLLSPAPEQRRLDKCNFHNCGLGNFPWNSSRPFCVTLGKRVRSAYSACQHMSSSTQCSPTVALGSTVMEG